MNTYYQPPATVCAENIAISYLLGEVQSEPLRNPANPACHDNNRYQFPLNKERNLTEILSFLAKITDGHEHIRVLRMGQYPQATHLSVLLAVNKSTWHDGNWEWHPLPSTKRFQWRSSPRLLRCARLVSSIDYDCPNPKIRRISLSKKTYKGPRKAWYVSTPKHCAYQI